MREWSDERPAEGRTQRRSQESRHSQPPPRPNEGVVSPGRAGEARPPDRRAVESLDTATRHGQTACASAAWADPVAAVRAEFGQPFRAFADEFLPHDTGARSKLLYCSDDTFRRWCEGKSLPEPRDLDGLVARLRQESGPTVPPERFEQLRIALKEAHEIPRGLRERVEAAKVQLADIIAIHAASAAKVEQLRGHIVALQQQLAVGHHATATALRAQLERANEGLQQALAQEHADGQVLRECATRMVEVVTAYLSLFTE